MSGLIGVMFRMAQDIKLSHSVFALPFALLATFLAAAQHAGGGRLPRWGEVGLILACMIVARTFAMLANRYLDRRIDAANPRTAGRALPSGALRPRQVLAAMAVCTVLFIIAAAGFGWAYGNWWPAMLSPLVLAWIGAYGYFKRFTAGAHFMLGSALAISPLAAGLAIEPSSLAQPALWWLAGFVLLWVAGFDIIYALQDRRFDQRAGLHSIPAKLAPEKALWAARGCHLLGLLALVLMQNHVPAFRAGAAWPNRSISWFDLAVVAVAILLMIEHRAAARGRFTMAFFTVNGVIALAVGGCAIADVVLFLHRGGG